MTGVQEFRLTATSTLCALGSDVRAVAASLFAPSVDSLRRRADLLPDRPMLVGEVRAELPRLPERLARWSCRNNSLALAALERIRPEVDRVLATWGPARVGVVLGTTTAGVAEAGEAVRDLVRGGALTPSFHYAQMEHGNVAQMLAECSGALGPAYSISTACSSSAKALVSARSLLELDLCDAVICGGVDTLCRMTARGFFALEAVAMDRTNPMSRNRRGLNLGEAAVLFVMARERGGIQLAGGGESSDAHHMSAPSPDGSGAEAAMRAALAQAGARADEILYVNLHGTGTPLNDSSESAAVHRVFGADVPCSSTKPRVGHTLGAAGALEAAFCAMTLESERDGELALPPHDWDRERDPELAPLRLAGPGETARARGRRLALSNGFGFGGNNCTLVLERCEP